MYFSRVQKIHYLLCASWQKHLCTLNCRLKTVVPISLMSHCNRVQTKKPVCIKILAGKQLLK